MAVEDRRPRMHAAAVVIAVLALLLLIVVVWFVHSRAVETTDRPSQPLIPDSGKK